MFHTVHFARFDKVFLRRTLLYLLLCAGQSNSKKHVKSGAVLNYGTLQRFVFKQTPKVWFRYVEAYLSKVSLCLSAKLCTNRTVSHNLIKQLMYSQHKSMMRGAQTLFIDEKTIKGKTPDTKTKNELFVPTYFKHTRPTGFFSLHEQHLVART